MAPFSSSFPSSSGLPLCLSRITSPLAFSKEVADHDRRRKVLKKLKHQINGECFWPLDQLNGAEIRQDHEIMFSPSDEYNSEEEVAGDHEIMFSPSDEYNSEEEVAGDLAGVVGDLSSLSLTSSSCTAKAA